MIMSKQKTRTLQERIEKLEEQKNKLIAESDPKQKDLITKLVMNLIENGGAITP